MGGLRLQGQYSQSVKTTESGGPRGYYAAKKVKGRKRRIVTDTTGLMFGAAIFAYGRCRAPENNGPSLFVRGFRLLGFSPGRISWQHYNSSEH
jgi:hypothetical protein